jgi:hypothetical protein
MLGLTSNGLRSSPPLPQSTPRWRAAEK